MPICLSFELTEAVFERPAHLVHSSTAPLRRFPVPLHLLLLRPTIIGVPLWRLFRLHHRGSLHCHCTIPFSLPTPLLHRTVEEVILVPLPLPPFNPAPLYVYFYVLGCFWIRLDLIFCIVCVFLYFKS